LPLLQFQLLGSCEFRDRTGRALPLTARKSRALLAFLALQAGAPQSREKLAALLWEDADAELGRTSLRQALSAIRRALPEQARAVLIADSMQVALDVSTLDIDVLELRALLAESTQASLKAAQSRASGVLLEGFDARSDAFEEWLAAERRGLRRDISSAMQMLVRFCREAGESAGEIDALSQLIALEPVNEAAHRELMDAFARAGRHTDALRQYQQCRSILRRELDLAPEPATDTLYRELMKRRRAAADADLDALPADIAEPEAPAPAGDDRMLRNGVVLTARLIGLAEYRRSLDPESARKLTQRLQESFDARVADHGGVADRFAGDRVHAVFGLDKLSGHEPHRALCTARALHQAFAESRLPLPGIAIGVAQGPLLPENANGPFPLAGHPMLEAESLAVQAAAGETLLADDLRRALHPRTAPFAGRHAELSLTVSLFERTSAARRGRTILIRGEAGIGKTRLLEALVEAAQAKGAACHRVQVLDFGQIKARRPLAALFSSLLGIGSETTPEEKRTAVTAAIDSGRLHPDDILHASGLASAPLSGDQASIERNVDPQALEHGRIAAVRRLIEASCQSAPLLLIIEDLHYAGGEEAARLGELAAAVATQPALLVLSTRPEEDPIDTAWRARARGCPLTTLDLAPLTDDEAHELAASYPKVPEALVADCIARAQGHPLFLDQLLRAADAGERALPATVQALVPSRMERLERAERQTLIAASVRGLRFPRGARAARKRRGSASSRPRSRRSRRCSCCPRGPRRIRSTRPGARARAAAH
jgi:DNA-binding SARP family transcriptional activator